MSSFVLSVIPTDPHWQPGRSAAERAAAVASALTLDDAAEIKTTWHESIVAVDCGDNLERITCPVCGGSIDREWYAALVEDHCDSGFATLGVTVPCCGAPTTLDALNYHWPSGFARFEVEIWEPGREWLTDEELARFAEALGHPVRQVFAHF